MLCAKGFTLRYTVVVKVIKTWQCFCECIKDYNNHRRSLILGSINVKIIDNFCVMQNA